MTIKRSAYPIIEFDDDPTAIITPQRYISSVEVSQHCVMCFFREVVESVVQSHAARVVSEQKWEDGVQRIYETEYLGRKIAFLHCLVGAPAAAALLEEAIAHGCRKFIVCGGAGIVGKQHPVGHIMVPASAVRDEGTSYHYLPPARDVSASPPAVAAIEEVLREKGLNYVVTKTWTTDAIFRETRSKVALRCGEGCLTVEMEAAALFAVAQVRNVSLGQILFAGDDVSGETWDRRLGHSRDEIRKALFWLAVEACLRL